MKVIEAVQKVKDLKNNTYDQAYMIEWLSRVDSMVKRLIIDTHEGGEDVIFNGYNDQTDPGTELLVPEPYADMYLRYLEAQIDFHNREYGSYNNSMAAFQAVWDNYLNDYRRTHRPKSAGGRFVF